MSVWPGGVPDGLFVYDIPSIVHVLDLAIVLPLLMLTGILPLRAHPVVPVLAAIVLTKTLTLGLALLSMNAFVAASGRTVDPAEPLFWAVIVVVSLGWLVAGARRMRSVPTPWLGRSIW